MLPLIFSLLQNFWNLLDSCNIKYHHEFLFWIAAWLYGVYNFWNFQICQFTANKYLIESFNEKIIFLGVLISGSLFLNWQRQETVINSVMVLLLVKRCSWVQWLSKQAQPSHCGALSAKHRYWTGCSFWFWGFWLLCYSHWLEM